MQEFTRWDLTKPPTLDNLILASAEECKKHEKEGLEGMDQKEVYNRNDVLKNREQEFKRLLI